MKIMVTGHAGFIGSHVAGALLEAGHQVVGVDNLNDYYDRRIKVRNVERLVRMGLDSHVLDLASDPLAHLMTGLDSVVHLAAQPGISDSVPFADYMLNNVVATERLLAAAQSTGSLTLFLYGSTSSVYGANATGDERAIPEPVSHYGVTKLCGEQLVMAAARSGGLPACAIRLFSVYGPGERPDKGFPKLIRSCLLGEEFTLFEGSENHSRSFSYISDIVQGIMTALHLPVEVRGQVINMGGSEAVMMKEVITEVERLSGRKLRLRSAPKRAGDQLSTRANIALAQRLLHYKPLVSVQEGLKREFDWILGVLHAQH